MSFSGSHSGITVASVFPVICTAALLLRLKARRKMGLGYGPDEWAAIVTLVFLYACCSVVIAGIVLIGESLRSTPLQSSTLQPEQIMSQFGTSLTLIFSFNPLSALALASTRLTFALFYLRLFGHVYRIKITIWILIGLSLAWTICFLVVSGLLCDGHYGVDPSVSDNRFCFDFSRSQLPIPIVMASSDAAMDIALFLLPLMTIYSLQLRSRQKFLLALVFLIGIVIVKVVVLVQWEFIPTNNGSLALVGPEIVDTLHQGMPVIWWTLIQTGIGCFVSNLPPALGLLRGKRESISLCMQQLKCWLTRKRRHAFGRGGPQDGASDMAELKTTPGSSIRDERSDLVV